MKTGGKSSHLQFSMLEGRGKNLHIIIQLRKLLPMLNKTKNYRHIGG